MGKRRFIVLDIQGDYPLGKIEPHIFYRITLETSRENRKYFYFFILNGNFYYESICYGNINKDLDLFYCCTIEKFKRFIAKTNISQFFSRMKKIRLETADDLRVMLMECGYKREIDYGEFKEAERELKSDFSKWHKYDDFHFISKKLNPHANPGDAQMGTTPFGATITFDMVSDRRKQRVPDCIKEEIIYWANTMLGEKLADIESVRFLLHAEIAFETIGTLFKSYKVNIVMVDKKGNQLHKDRFCLCDCEKGQEEAMEEYFRNELFPGKTVGIMEGSVNGNG
ncbi:hypothetical protein D7V86_26260 [bacterium D16-51]|nr:hypothetical protein D7V96_26290 [bacterium D16-59]RKI51828.1 hypothetical protein D7V86_26260 [bacterium D16-51]